MGYQCDDFPLCRLRPEECQSGTRSCEDLLLFGAGELAEDGLGDGTRRLNCEGIHEHVRSRCHLEYVLYAQPACAAHICCKRTLVNQMVIEVLDRARAC
jgi:hypothetical protein